MCGTSPRDRSSDKKRLRSSNKQSTCYPLQHWFETSLSFQRFMALTHRHQKPSGLLGLNHKSSRALLGHALRHPRLDHGTLLYYVASAPCRKCISFFFFTAAVIRALHHRHLALLRDIWHSADSTIHLARPAFERHRLLFFTLTAIKISGTPQKLPNLKVLAWRHKNDASWWRVVRFPSSTALRTD